MGHWMLADKCFTLLLFFTMQYIVYMRVSGFPTRTGISLVSVLVSVLWGQEASCECAALNSVTMNAFVVPLSC